MSMPRVRLIKPATSPLLSSRAVADDILDVTASTEALGKTAGKDLNMDKTTYPKLLGLDGSRKEARRLVDEAKSALSIFGDRATPLLAIADYIVDREN
jgi:geranylgeranyl diphosphate synthase type II